MTLISGPAWRDGLDIATFIVGVILVAEFTFFLFRGKKVHGNVEELLKIMKVREQLAARQLIDAQRIVAETPTQVADRVVETLMNDERMPTRSSTEIQEFRDSGIRKGRI